MKSLLLEKLYDKYDIANLTFGKIHDKLGDLYEDYCIDILQDVNNLYKANNHIKCDSLEYSIFTALLSAYNITAYDSIESITATNIVPHRETHGLSKTDIIATIHYVDKSEQKLAISCKQSTVPKVAFAEFDVETICREVGITDEILKSLLLKHQTDASAKNFTAIEREQLKGRLAPIARKFVRWVITGSIEEHPANVVFPTSIIKFQLKKPQHHPFSIANGDFAYQSFKVHTIEEYIDSIMLANGKIKNGGFGTGLSWTYATGSKGVKIQFKA